MNDAPLETIFLSQIVTDGKLTLRTPIHKYKKGIWQIAIESISLELDFEENSNGLCCLKCNWVTNVCYNKNFELKSQSPVILQWYFSEQKKCFHANNLIWYDINSLSQTIVFEVLNLSSDKVIDFTCKMNIIILIRKKA